MNRRLIIRPEAEVDITDVAIWYEGREPGLGLEVTSEIHSAIQRALDNPLSYPLLRKSPQVHRNLVRRFPYRIFYIVEMTRSSFSPCFTQHGMSGTGRNGSTKLHETKPRNNTKLFVIE